jgi:hypothetical protein
VVHSSIHELLFMPILHFTNSTDESLNIGALFAGLPSVCKNELAPGETWAQDFGTLLFSSFEGRIDKGTNRFEPDSAIKDVGHVAGAAGKGAAAVLKGAGAFVGAFPTGAAAKAGTGKAMEDASNLMNAAGEGKRESDGWMLLMTSNSDRGRAVRQGRGWIMSTGRSVQRWLGGATLHP